MKNDSDIITLITNLLDDAKYKEAISVPNDKHYVETFKDNCSDLISALIERINDETAITKPSLWSACEELLSIIVQKATPEEVLLEFIEQIEIAKNDAQFCIILNPLQNLLIKLSIKRGRSLEWCLNSISTYIESIPIPEHHLEGQERLLNDCDPNIRRIIRVYSQLPLFYNPFIKEVSAADANIKTKEIITAFLISLLGKPLIYIDLDPENNANGEAYQSCATIIQDICTIQKDVLKFLKYLEVCSEEKQYQNANKLLVQERELSPYEQREKINMDTLSGLYYGIFSGHFEIPDTVFPQVYSTEYILQTVLLTVTHFLNYTQFAPLSKAMFLCKALLNRFSCIFSDKLLSSSIHFNLCKMLVNVAIFSSYPSIRKNSVSLIDLHINKFEYKGRCKLIKCIFDFSNHSGMIGFAISLYKNSINEAFKQSENLPECFSGDQFTHFLMKICHLPHGAESDIMELADQIITALNFLRFLVIKDIKNSSGIRNSFKYLENEYLSQLRVGLNMSKAHYEVKLKEIEEGKELPDGPNITINIGGNMLKNIPRENIKEIINSALNAFHLIEGLIARLSECINLHKMQELSMESLRVGRRYVAPLGAVLLTNTAQTMRTYCSKSTNSSNIESSLPVTLNNQEDQQYEDNVKTRILEKSLQFVTTNGWSIESLSAGAEAAGYPGVAHGLFPQGGGDLVHYFNVKCNEELVEQMKIWPKIDTTEVPSKFIENAIVTRLQMIDPYKSTWSKAMAIQALPNNVPNCLASLLSLVDDICYHSGDRSVDFNWYIRRVGLAGIYKASELFYLTDSSQAITGTRAFVAARIRDAELVQTAMNMNPVAVAPQTLTAAFVTAKNILGINTLK